MCRQLQAEAQQQSYIHYINYITYIISCQPMPAPWKAVHDDRVWPFYCHERIKTVYQRQKL